MRTSLILISTAFVIIFFSTSPAQAVKKKNNRHSDAQTFLDSSVVSSQGVDLHRYSRSSLVDPLHSEELLRKSKASIKRSDNEEEEDFTNMRSQDNSRNCNFWGIIKYTMILILLFVVIISGISIVDQTKSSQVMCRTSAFENTQTVPFVPGSQTCSSQMVPQEYDVDLEKEFRLEPPFIECYNHGSKLCYMGVNHEVSPTSKSFQLIREVIDEFKPDIIIQEGYPTNLGLSPQFIKNKINSDHINNEIYFAAEIALQRSITFIGGEIDDQEVVEFLRDTYNLKDIVFFYFTQKIPQYFQEKKINSIDGLEDLFNQFLTSSFPSENALSFSSYKQWLKRILGKDLAFAELVNSQLTAPIKRGTVLQKISSEISIKRDKNIISLIERSLKKYQKILVIYGHSHYLTQKDALEKVLGIPFCSHGS